MADERRNETCICCLPFVINDATRASTPVLLGYFVDVVNHVVDEFIPCDCLRRSGDVETGQIGVDVREAFISEVSVDRVIQIIYLAPVVLERLANVDESEEGTKIAFEFNERERGCNESVVRIL